MQTDLDLTTTAEGLGAVSRPIVIALPAAPPQTYLRWMRWWRKTERRARARIESGDLVSRLALIPHPSALLWDVLACDVSRQAGLAKRLGQPSVTPRIRTTNLILVRAFGYMDRRQRFLETGITERSPLRIARPSAELVELRRRVLHAAARQLAAPRRTPVRSRQVAPSPRARGHRLPVGSSRGRPGARARTRSHESRNPSRAA
jgi:hypothetical protein